MRLGHLNNNTTQTEKKLAQEVLTFSHVSQGIDDLLSERGVRSESQLGFTRGPTRGIYNNDSHVKSVGVFFSTSIDLICLVSQKGNLDAQRRRAQFYAPSCSQKRLGIWICFCLFWGFFLLWCKKKVLKEHILQN